MLLKLTGALKGRFSAFKLRLRPMQLSQSLVTISSSRGLRQRPWSSLERARSKPTQLRGALNFEGSVKAFELHTSFGIIDRRPLKLSKASEGLVEASQACQEAQATRLQTPDLTPSLGAFLKAF